MTLVELLVAITLTTIVLVAVATVFAGSLRTMSKVRATGDLTGHAQIGMEIIGGRLRSADYLPPEDANPSVILDAAFNAVTVSAHVHDQPLADALAAQVLAANSTSSVGLYLQATKLVPKRVRYAYVASGSICGTSAGIGETVTSPRYSPSGGQTFVWDAAVTPLRTRCALRTTMVPSLVSVPPYSVFKYYDSCAATGAEIAAPYKDIAGVAISLRARDLANNSVELQNRICLVNVHP